jgi:hypothetical protein
MSNQCFYLTLNAGTLSYIYQPYISLTELQSKIKQNSSNLQTLYSQYATSFDIEKCNIIEEWYKAYLIEQELEVLSSIPAERAADYNAAKATIDRLTLIHDAAYAKKAGALHV